MQRSKKTHKTISPQEAAAAHSQGELALVDVRESAERAIEHVAGSHAANVRGGLLAWRETQLPLVTGSQGSDPDPIDAA